MTDLEAFVICRYIRRAEFQNRMARQVRNRRTAKHNANQARNAQRRALELTFDAFTR